MSNEDKKTKDAVEEARQRAADEAAAKKKADDEAADAKIKASEKAESSADVGKTPSQDPSDVANGANGAKSRARSAESAEAGEKNDEVLTRFEAAHKSSMQSVSPSSQTLQNPDAELKQELTNDVLTAQREALAREVAAGGVNVATLQEALDAHQAVADAQAEVDAAIVRRDAARTAYDRVIASQTGAVRFEEQVGGYLEAMNQQREAAAKTRNQAQGIDLAGLLAALKSGGAATAA